MATLLEVAQRIQDLYQQDFTTNTEFMDIGDFKFQVGITYSSLLNAMYQSDKRENKAQDGFSNIEIPASWLFSEELTISKEGAEANFFATTKHEIYFFDWDSNANSIQDVVGIGCGNCQYRKISLNERRFLKNIPPVNVTFYWAASKNRIQFHNVKDNNKVTVQYIPSILSLEDDCILSDNIFPTIVDTTLDRMFKAKNGNFIQKLDDQNPNIDPAQQINPTATTAK